MRSVRVASRALPDVPRRTESCAPLPARLILGSFAVFAAVYLFLHWGGLLAGWLEDLPVYSDALRAFSAGIDPYAQVHGSLHFVYPAAVLYAGRLFADAMPGDSEWVLLVCIHLAAAVAAPLILARYYIRTPWLTPAMAALVWFAEPRFTGMMALYSSNVAPSLYLALLVAAIPGIKRDRWTWFYAVLFMAAIVKVTFLTMLLFPLLAGRRQWWRSVACVTGVAAVYWAQKLMTPSLYAGYKSALLQQVQVQGLYGYGIFGMAANFERYRLHHPVGALSYAAHALFTCILVSLLLCLRHRGAEAAEPRMWLGLLLMAAVVMNPRVLHYDAYLALFAAFVVLALTLELEGWKLIALLAGLFVPSLLVPLVIHSQLMYGAYELIVILVALAAGMWRLWRRTAPDLIVEIQDVKIFVLNAVAIEPGTEVAVLPAIVDALSTG